VAIGGANASDAPSLAQHASDLDAFDERTPRLRAPFASDIVRSAGFALRRPDPQAAVQSSVRSNGYSSPARFASITSTSTPKLPRKRRLFAQHLHPHRSTPRRLTPCRIASSRWPSRLRFELRDSSMPYLLICVMFRFGRIWPTSPAACQSCRS